MNTGNQIKGQALFQRQQKNKNNCGPTIICDGLQTPENFGSILRVADAAGSKRIILLDSALDLGNKKLSKLARSTDKHLLIEHYSLQQLIDIRKEFKHICALEITSLSTNAFDDDITICDAVMLGHESSGIRQDALALCDKAIHLPMFGTNGSMNVSHALVVFLYERHRQIKAG